MTGNPILIRPQPGIQRDGTMLDATGWVDGQWVRFQRGLPRKMRGFRTMSKDMAGIPRGIDTYSRNGDNYVHVGSQANLQQVIVDRDGNAASATDRTPATLANSPANVWQFDQMYDSIINNNARLIAHVAPNLTDIDSDDPGQIYYNDLFSPAALVAGVTSPPVSGGIVVLHPYLMAYGSNGFVAATIPNNPDDFLGAGSFEGNVTDQKIVTGSAFRGGGDSPSGLLWSLNSLIRVSYGGVTIWRFDSMSDQISIMSSRATCEASGIHYWMGIDRFFAFNGTVMDLPNNNSTNWVFDNINMSQRQKVFTFRNSRWGEIWWCFPFGSATECTHAVIYNYRENIWFDTKLPSPRSSATSPEVYPYPVMGGVDLVTATSTFKIFAHEYGVDEIDDNVIKPISSYIESAPISLLLAEQPQNKAVNVQIIEPDFIQTGDIKMTVTGRATAHAADFVSEEHIIKEPSQDANGQIVRLKETRRQMRFRFESNEIGGDFQFGRVYAHIEPTDGRIAW